MMIGGGGSKKNISDISHGKPSKEYVVHLKVNQKIPKEPKGKARNQGTTEDTHTGRCTNTAESADVKIRHFQHGK
jgi:hypothetical protein